MKRVIRRGWGTQKVAQITLGEISEFTENTRGDSGLAVGLGRSYGDSSLNSNGTSWRLGIKNFIEINPATGIAHVSAGVTIGELERASLVLGFFPPVVPGTEYVTIGGAIAADVHGKSHHKYGTFSNHVIEMTIMKSSGELSILNPFDSTRDEFSATSGGMGLTGIIVSARIKLIVVETSYFNVEETRASSLDEIISQIEYFDSRYDYTVAWIDLSGDFKGRGRVSGGNHALKRDLPIKLRKRPLQISEPINFKLPSIFPSFTINKATVRIFNALWFRKPLTIGLQHSRNFLHPLDPIQNWNRIYGRRGFIQYQFVVPLESVQFLFEVLDSLKSIKATSFLTVLKKFQGSENPYLSFPKPGWTLAIDIPLGVKGLEETLSELDDQLTTVGGKIYLAKDSRLSQINFEKMYPDIPAWLELKKEMDPHNYWQSDQGRRLGLC